MSSIDHMSIQGIRSFGPDDSNRQLIKFFKPLTLILGPNGTGKTTIIECLRYVSTGDTPPSTDKGSAFVHDPKVAHEIEIKGQVRLQLTDVSGKKVAVTRSMLATQKQKKISMKSLEGVIQRIGASGEVITISSKCSELQNEMVASLGVSKAILNNVIFCHQEESNWPLCEGKILKQRFDDIFAATRYIKALESIKKLRAEKMQDVRQYDTEVKYLKGHKEKAKEHQEELKNITNRLTACNDKIKQIDKEMEPLQEKLAVIADKEDKLNSLASDLASKEGKLEEQRKSLKEIQASIKEVFRGDLDELLEELNTLSTERSKKRARCQQFEDQINTLQSQYKKLREKKEKLLEELGNLKSALRRHEERIKHRGELALSLREELGMRKIHKERGKPVDEAVIQETSRIIDEKLTDAQQELKNEKIKLDEEEQELQSVIDNLRDQKTKFDQSTKLNSDQITKNKREIQSIYQKLGLADSMVTKQQDLQDCLKSMEGRLKEVDKNTNVDDLRSKIKKDQSEQEKLEKEHSLLSIELSNLQKENTIRTEVDLITKDKNGKEEMIKTLQERHKGTLIHLLGEMPAQNIHNRLQRYMNDLDDEIRLLTRETEKKRSSVTSLETTKKHLLAQIKLKENELKDHQNKIFEVCSSQDFDEELSSLQATLRDLQDDKGAITGSQYMFKKYVSTLQKPQPCCPLCTRRFEQDSDAQDLVQDLQRKLQLIPSKLARMQDRISEQQERLNSMLELRPLREVVKNLKEKVVPELKEELKHTTDEINRLKQEISEEDENIEIKQMDHKMSLSLHSDTASMDQNIREIERLENKLASLVCQLGSEGVARNIDQVSGEQEMVNKKLNFVKSEIEKTQKIINEHIDRVQKIREQINNVKEELFQISSDLQKRSSLEERRKQLSAENSRLENEVKNAKNEIKFLEDKLQIQREKKEELSHEKENALEQARKKCSTLEKHKLDLSSYTEQIRRFIQEGKVEALTLHQNNLDEIEASMKLIEDKLKTSASQKQKIEEEIVSFELKKVDLEKNKSFLEYKNSIRKMEIIVDNLKSEFGDLSATSILRDKQKLRDKLTTFLNEREQSKGRQGELQRQIRQRTDELNSDMFKDADKKYTNKLIELRTTQMACEDLNKYYTALNYAVMQYHTVKMKEINKIIRQLWSETYTGNDIDYIEIRSDEHDVGTSLDRKRTYNYRVVMIKQDVVVDMRGCCSAGQKVLASLIIRLALAETFCLNCGILALDEPTTNLDRKNIASLAAALKKIVDERRAQRNFQLIVITHDEEFIEQMAHDGAVEKFYRVYKDSHGFSRLEKCAVADVR